MIRKSTLTISIISFLSAVYLMTKSDGMPYFNYIFLLPLCFCLLQFLRGLKEVGGNTNIVIDLMAYVGVIRYILSPIMLQLSDCATKITNYTVFENDTAAILLQLYEMIAIWSLCIFTLHQQKTGLRITIGRIELSHKTKRFVYSTNALLEMSLAFLAVFVFCVIKHPSLLKSYNPVWNMLSVEADTYSYYVPSSYYALSQITMNGFRATMIVYLLKIIGERNYTEAQALRRIFIVICMSILMVSDNRAYTFFYAVAILISVMIVYPRSKKIVFGLLALVGILALALLLGVSSASFMASSSPLKMLSETLQSYFQGTTNISVALSLSSYNLGRLFADIGKSITGIAYFFQEHEDIKVLFNAAYYYNSSRTGQIIPFIGQGYFYFGYILSPILTCFVLNNAMNSTKSLREHDNLDWVFIQVFKSTIAIVSLGMYTFTTYISTYASLIVPLIVASIYARLRYKIKLQ